MPSPPPKSTCEMVWPSARSVCTKSASMPERGFQRSKIGDLAADMDIDAGDLDARQFCGAGIDGARVLSGTPNLFSDLPVEIFACVPESTSGLTRIEIRAVRPISTASRDSNSSSGSDSTLMQSTSSASACAQFGLGLADAGEQDLVRRNARGAARA